MTTIEKALKELRETNDYEEEDIIAWGKLLEKFGNKNNKYMLVAEGYDRCPGGTGVYHLKFNAPNDYVALMCMCCHCEPTIDEIIDYFGSVQALLDECPTYEDLLSHASCNWWGDGDDFIMLVENLSEDKTLYEAGD